jgi:hypothetical protein
MFPFSFAFCGAIGFRTPFQLLLINPLSTVFTMFSDYLFRLGLAIILPKAIQPPTLTKIPHTISTKIHGSGYAAIAYA